MPEFIDIKGKRFGKLVALERAEDYVSPKGYRQTNWLCQCDCGNQVIVRRCNLVNGFSTSCGCNRIEHPNHLQHGLSNTRIHNIWDGMKDRCTNPNSVSYSNYGGRGITICDEWRNNFLSFYNWSIENGYADNLSIDRIDVNGNYEPENCRWADAKTQANNARRNHTLTYHGKTMTISQWADEKGMSYSKLKSRINKCGWSVEKALETV